MFLVCPASRFLALLFLGRSFQTSFSEFLSRLPTGGSESSGLHYYLFVKAQSAMV